MKCPEHRVDLVPHELEDVAVLRCSQDDGLWFTEEAFRLAKDSAEPDAMWLDVELWRDHDRFTVHSRELPCPACGEAMVTLRYEHTPVEVDYCPTDRGIWLHETDFHRIVAALHEEVRTMPAGELLAAALHEGLEILNGPEPRILEWQDAARVLSLLKARVLADHPTLTRLVGEFLRGKPLP